MTLIEFKAWFEGYTESMDSTPNEKQWARIKARVKEIDGAPITYPVYVDRYWPRVAPYYWSGYPFSMGAAGGIGVATVAGGLPPMNNISQCGQNASFNGTDAMLALGRAEALS